MNCKKFHKICKKYGVPKGFYEIRATEKGQRPGETVILGDDRVAVYFSGDPADEELYRETAASLALARKDIRFASTLGCSFEPRALKWLMQYHRVTAPLKNAYVYRTMKEIDPAGYAEEIRWIGQTAKAVFGQDEVLIDEKSFGPIVGILALLSIDDREMASKMPPKGDPWDAYFAALFQLVHEEPKYDHMIELALLSDPPYIPEYNKEKRCIAFRTNPVAKKGQ